MKYDNVAVAGAGTPMRFYLSKTNSDTRVQCLHGVDMIIAIFFFVVNCQKLRILPVKIIFPVE